MSAFKAAIVGTGGISQQHADGYLKEKGRVRLVAAVDIRPEAVEGFCAKNGIPGRYTDLGEMLQKEKPDLVSVSTPPGLHADQTIQALKAGAWVLCEKPMVGALADLDRVEAVEKETGRYACSVFQWRFGSAALHYKRLIDSGTFGKPLTGACLTTWYRNDAYYEVPWRGKWKTELGGCTVGHGIHAMDLFLSFLGDWDEVQAKAAALDRKIEVDDVSGALLHFKSGAIATILNSVISPRQETRIRWDFQKATVEVVSLYHHEPKHWTLSVPEGAAWAGELKGWTTDPKGSSSGHGAQISAILDDMEKKRAPLSRGIEVRRTLEFITALYKSSATGLAVKAGSIKPGDPFYDSFNGGRGL